MKKKYALYHTLANIQFHIGDYNTMDEVRKAYKDLCNTSTINPVLYKRDSHTGRRIQVMFKG